MQTATASGSALLPPSDDTSNVCASWHLHLPQPQTMMPVVVSDKLQTLQHSHHLHYNPTMIFFCLGGIPNHNEYFMPSKVGGYKEQYLNGGIYFQKSPT